MHDDITQEELLGETAWDHIDPEPECPECGGSDWTHHEAEYEDGFMMHASWIECNLCGEVI